jgi:molybdopterin-binding protein
MSWSEILLDTLKDLALKPGDKVKAIVKAVNVVLVKEG